MDVEETFKNLNQLSDSLNFVSSKDIDSINHLEIIQLAISYLTNTHSLFRELGCGKLIWFPSCTIEIIQNHAIPLLLPLINDIDDAVRMIAEDVLRNLIQVGTAWMETYHDQKTHRYPLDTIHCMNFLKNLSMERLNKTKILYHRHSSDFNATVLRDDKYLTLYCSPYWDFFETRINISPSYNSTDFQCSYMKSFIHALHSPRCTEDSKILCLGLGGAELPMYILSHFPKIHLEIVEKNPFVIEACTELGFTTHKYHNVKIHWADGKVCFNHIEATNYSIIFVDIFSSGKNPDFLFNSCFHKNLVEHVNPRNGQVIINCADKYEAYIIQKIYKQHGYITEIITSEHKESNVCLVYLSSIIF